VVSKTGSGFTSKVKAVRTLIRTPRAVFVVELMVMGALSWWRCLMGCCGADGDGRSKLVAVLNGLLER
jgi:hypothetical protein